MVKLDLSGARPFFDPTGPDYAAAAEAHRTLFGKSGQGSEFIGWLDLPGLMLGSQLKTIINTAEKITRDSDALLIVGTGASYLGVKAAIEFLRPAAESKTQLYFLGSDLSPDYVNELSDNLGDKDFSVFVVSKCSDTLETAIAFRIAKSLLEHKYGRVSARRRIYVCTDEQTGYLRSMAENEGYVSFSFPSDLTECFSMLSPAALLPMAVAEIDIEAVLRSAEEEMRSLAIGSPENPAWQYAAARQHLYRRGKNIEILSYCESSLRYFSRWRKQLFGECEGKNSVGIFPATLESGAELYSMGQYIQDGPRTLMESVLKFDAPRTDYKLPFEMGDPDALNHLAGRSLASIAEIIASTARSTHIAGGVPSITISVPRRDEAGFASLVCFFQVACGISAYMMGVNPFSREGANEYKSNLFSAIAEENK